MCVTSVQMAMHGVVIKDFHTNGKCIFSSIKVTHPHQLHIVSLTVKVSLHAGELPLRFGSSVKVGRLLSFVCDRAIILYI